MMFNRQFNKLVFRYRTLAYFSITSLLPTYDELKIFINVYRHLKYLPRYRRAAMFNAVIEQESPAVADKPARRLRKVCTVYVRAVG